MGWIAALYKHTKQQAKPPKPGKRLFIIYLVTDVAVGAARAPHSVVPTVNGRERDILRQREAQLLLRLGTCYEQTPKVAPEKPCRLRWHQCNDLLTNLILLNFV